MFDTRQFKYIHVSNSLRPPRHRAIRIQQRLLANYVPGDTHNLQRSTGYQFSGVRYYILSYGQKYISGYDFNHLSKMTQKEFKVTLRMIALFEYSSQ